MATGKLTANPEPVPAGVDRTTLSVTFQTDPGGPSVLQTLAKVDVFNPDGTVAGNVTVTWNGPGAPEPTPIVRLAEEATTGWRLGVSHGELNRKPSVVNEFEWIRVASMTLPGITTMATLTDPNNGTADQVSVTWEGTASPSTPTTPSSPTTPPTSP